MEQKDFQKFDRLMKRALRLSKGTVIEFINSLYGKHYDAENSTITYLNPEYPTNEHKEYADSMLEINGTDKYHMEIQMENDDTMVFRMFEYEYQQARESARGSRDSYEMRFAEPKVIYLQHTKNTPDEMQIRITFEGQGSFDYKVRTFKALAHTPEELANAKLYLLIPFQLLATRELKRKDISSEKRKYLLGEYDKRLESMVKVLDNAYRNRNIQTEDYQQLYVMIQDIREYLYKGIPEVNSREVNKMLEEKDMLWSERIAYQAEARGEAKGEARGKAELIEKIRKYAEHNNCSLEKAFLAVEAMQKKSIQQTTPRKPTGRSR